jgi:WD40 repeat protein
MIRTLAVSSDNKLVASAGADHTIIIWNIDSGKQISTLTGHNAWVLCLAFSHDKEFLASGSYDGVIRIWNLTKRKVEFEINDLRPLSINSLVFSPDGNKLIIASANSEISVWDMRIGKMTSSLKGHSRDVTQVTFLSDEKTLVSSSLDKTMRFWDVTTKKAKTLVSVAEGISGFAFSPDETFVATTTIDNKIEVFEYKNNTIKKAVLTIPPRRLPANPDQIEYRNWRLGFAEEGMYSAGSLYFLSGNELAFVDGVRLRIWDVVAGKEESFRAIKSGFGAYAVNGCREENLLIYNDGERIELMEVTTQKIRELRGWLDVFDDVAFSLDGKTLLGAFGANRRGKWGKKKHSFKMEEASALLRRIDNRTMAYLWGERLTIKIKPNDPIQPDIYLLQDDGQVTAVLRGHKAQVTAIAVSPDETVLASNSKDGACLLWDLKTRKVVKSLRASGELIRFSPDGRFLAISDESKSISLFDLKDLDKEPSIINADVRKVMLFSPDSKVLAAIITSKDILPDKDRASLWFIDRYMRARPVLAIWRVSDGAPVNSFELFDLQGGLEFFCAECVMGQKTNIEPFGFAFFDEVGPYLTIAGPVAFWKDNDLIASSVLDPVTGIYKIKIWNTVSGEVVHSISGHKASIRSLTFSPNGEFLASASFDGTIRLWSLARDTELARLVILDENGWVVHTPDGRFDTNIDLDDMDKLSWVWPTDPLNPLSLRIFMRDYDERKLLDRILAGETLDPVRDLSRLNRTQPIVRIEQIKPDIANTVQVTIEVTNTLGSSQTDAKGLPMRSGVFDVRLLRDGQLVGSSTENMALAAKFAEAKGPRNLQALGEQELEVWRRLHEVKLGADGRGKLTFHRIKVPLRNEVTEVSFSAYAFNSDRVTSETTTPSIYAVPRSSTSVKRRAYVVTIGVDATSDPNWRLSFAPTGAREIDHLLREKLQRQYEVIGVSLISEYKKGTADLEQDAATKANVQAVLNLLSGQTGLTASEQAFPMFQPATPDDLVILYLASHGYADRNGTFYIIPSDIGEPAGINDQVLDRCANTSDQSRICQEARAFLAHCVSSDELRQWLQPIDAGQIVLVLDSCHSAAVSGSNFKLGPMGDPTFGQLAYDKGMLILAATQTENVAWGTLDLGDRSLLTYALTNQTGETTPFNLSEWLSQAEQSVPTLYRRFVKNQQSTVSDTEQEPELFDFTRKRTSVSGK